MRLSKIFISLILLACASILNASESELIEKRGFFSKTFQLDNGLEKLVIHAGPIHYVDSGNRFVEVGYPGSSDYNDLLSMAMTQSELWSNMGTPHEYNKFENDCTYDSEPVFVTQESAIADYQTVRYYTQMQFNNSSFEPYYQIQSVSHKMAVGSHIQYGPTDNGEYTLFVKEFTFPEGSYTDCDVYDAIGSGDILDQVAVDFSNYIDPTGEQSVLLPDFVSVFQDMVDQAPVAQFMNVRFGYSIGNTIYDVADFYNLYLNGAPTLEVVYKTTITGMLANRHLPTPTADMGGTLSIIDHDNAAHTHEHIGSLTPVELNPGDICTALTDSIGFNASEFHHHSWNSVTASGYSIQLSQFLIDETEYEISAFFNDQFQLTLPTGSPEISLKDPWYVSNPSANPEDWIQPNIYRTVAEMQSDNSSRVFKDQNDDFSDSIPIYYLNAPQFTDEGNGEYFIFHHWEGSHVLYGVGQTTTTDNETTVVFTSSSSAPLPYFNQLSVSGGASVWEASDTLWIKASQFYYENNDFYEFSHWSGDSITLGNSTSYLTTVEALSGDATATAVYNTGTASNSIQNKTINIHTDESISIPAGANIQFAEGVTIDIAGSFSVNGTPGSPVNFESTGRQSPFPAAMTEHPSVPLDKLIKITGDGANCTITYLQLSDAYCGISIEGDNANIEIEDVTFSDLNYALNIEPVSNTTFEISGSKFHNLDNGIVYSTNINNPGVSTSGLLHHNEFSDIADRAVFIRLETKVSGNNSINTLGIRANTFYNNGTSIYCQRESGTATYFGDYYLYITNTLFSESPTLMLPDDQVIYLETSEGYESDNNLFHNSGTTWYIGTTTADPKFVNTSTGDLRLCYDSPAVDAGFVDDDTDDWPDFFIDEDPDGTDPEIGAYYCPQTTLSTATSINADTEWYGIYNINEDVFVNTGKTLTIVPGSVLRFPDRSERVVFDINGNLVANGSPEAPITFTSSDATPAKNDWNGIRIFGTSDDNVTILDNCIVEYSCYGIYPYSTSPNISNNISRMNTYGYYARYNSSDVNSNQFVKNTYGVRTTYASPTFTNNLIRDNSYRGMYFYGTSTPRMYNNTIDSSNGYGIYMYNHVDVQFGHAGVNNPGYNEIINNASYGIYASYYCDPFLGTSDPYNQQVAGDNSIHDNGTYNLRTYNHSTAEAEWNWWDSETTWSAYSSSSYDTSPVLGSAPSASLLGSDLAKGTSYDGYADCPAIRNCTTPFAYPTWIESN
ncbi:MAG: right-handed parallel beta-helix repeat-containing protein [Candidatus Marinimicrobia bacterium]|nr:right-handed parallel beta-helix repeat-containing protein [Candidatus Neomarinimicrobiota bacterium]